MNHDDPEIDKRMRELYAQKTPEQRLAMVSSMFDSGVAMLKAGLLDVNPSLTESQLRWAVFERLYGDCYDADELVRIRNYLDKR
ncbi:MAG TPA: hypothetical protein VGK19_09565 [Capsulimonadaceae bacterium]|jgi:hypothetical protein